MAEQPIVERGDAPFHAQRYWEERLQAHPDITGVGFLGLSPRFVDLQYRSFMDQLERALRQHGLSDLAERSVLDVGSGIGVWVNFWREHGAARVVGLDFAQPSVELLKKRFPDATIVQADLSVSPLPLPQESRFELISAFMVLLHIVDPEGFRRALANLAHHCAPGGWLMINDAIVGGQGYVPAFRAPVHNTVRTLAEYTEVLKENGFVVEAVYPANVFLNTPLEASSRLAYRAYRLVWEVSRRWGRSNALSRLFGPGLLLADRLACRRFAGSTSPSAKIIFARKQA